MRSLFFLFLIPVTLFAQKPLPALKVKALNARTASTDTVYIVNFWATWCAPCVAELPEFDALQQRFAGQPVKVLLVSLDFKEDIRNKVPAFIRRKKLQPEVVWLAETDANAFIPKIEPRWTGSIPATLILDNQHKRRTFLERPVTEKEVAEVVNDLLNNPN